MSDKDDSKREVEAPMAHRQRKRPWPAAPMVSMQLLCDFFFCSVLQRMRPEIIAVCPVEIFSPKVHVL